MRKSTVIASIAALLTLGLSACGDDGGSSSGDTGGVDTGADLGSDTGVGEIPYETLSEYGLFAGDGAAQEPVEGVIPYEVNVQLFADQSIKLRFIQLPDGETIQYDADDAWSFPVGAIIVKTFGYLTDYRDPALGYTLMETRLLIHEPEGWTAHTYVWNDEQTEAFRTVVGERVPITWIDAEGVEQSLDYRVPNTNQCARCHGDPNLSTLGPHTRQLDRDNDYGGETLNQVDHLASLGMFSGAVPERADRDQFPSIFDEQADLDARARAYLDVNCSHCHSEDGAAASTGLYLDYRVTDPRALGVCRVPFAAGAGTGGRLWDVVPGEPDESVMVYRMESLDPDVKMPELPSQLADEDGVALIRAWIEAMDRVDCSE